MLQSHLHEANSHEPEVSLTLESQNRCASDEQDRFPMYRDMLVRYV